MGLPLGNVLPVNRAPSSVPFGGAFPLEGEKACGRPSVPPYGKCETCQVNSQGAVRRDCAGSAGSANLGAAIEPQQRQILQTQGPSGPGWNGGMSLRFCAPESLRSFSGGAPVNGVRGKRPMGLGGTKWSRSPSDASPAAFCLLFRRGKSRSPPAGGEIPPASGEMIGCNPEAKRSFAQNFFACFLFQRKQVNSSGSAWARESGLPGPQSPWRRRDAPAAPGRSPAGRQTPPHPPPACRGRGSDARRWSWS